VEFVLTSKERVLRALQFQHSDRTPRDFAAVPEVWQRLVEHFGTSERSEILDRLNVDCRLVSYDSYCHHPDIPDSSVDLDASRERSSTATMWRAQLGSGVNRDIWGACRRKVRHGFGELDELVGAPLAEAASLEDLHVYRWPEPDWWDFSQLREDISRLNEKSEHSIRYRVGSVFETAWSLRGMEQFLLDCGSAPELSCYIMDRIAEVHVENLRRVLTSAHDLIDIVYFYDDLASQEGLMLSERMYARMIQPYHARIIEVASSFGKPVMMHSCGAVYRLIPRLIDMGLSVLNPIQTTARGMDPAKLAREFGEQLVFHGAIDVQRLLPTATPAVIREHVALMDQTLGSHGGYIRSGSHHLQADTPLENVLAMYSV
jgi:uroporphyrinogen decarboxylase